jgi:hypothetical protein
LVDLDGGNLRGEIGDEFLQLGEGCVVAHGVAGAGERGRGSMQGRGWVALVRETGEGDGISRALDGKQGRAGGA